MCAPNKADQIWKKELCSQNILVYALLYHFLKIYQTSYYHSLSFFICKMILVITEIMSYIMCSVSIDLKAPQNLELKTNLFGGELLFLMEEKIKKKY